MILVDTSVWIDFFRGAVRTLSVSLEECGILVHPFVMGELAIGRLSPRDRILNLLAKLPGAVVATDPEVLGFIDRHALAGSGIGYIDAHLLASTALSGDTRLWSRDRKLTEVARRLNLSVSAG